jgi:preprotein translocase subunit SecG
MFGLLLTLLLIDGALLAVIVLLQSGKGGGLASMGGGMGTDTLIGGRQAATILTKATWIAGGLFLFLALALSIVSSRQQAPESILRGEFQPAQQQAAPAPIQVPGTEQAEPAPAGEPTTPATTN